MKHRCPKCGARWSWIGCGCFRAAAIVAALLLLPAIIQADAPGDRQRSPATLHETRRPRPMLKVWGCDHHAACQRFAADYRTLPQFRDALESRFDVRFVNVHGPLRLNLAGASAGITHCPTFEPLDRAARIEGYRDPDTLLQALGLPAIAPSRGTIVAPGDAAATPPPAMPDPTAAPGEAVPDVHAQAAAQLRAEFERLQQWAAEHTTATSEQIAEHRRVLEIIAKRIDDDGTPAELEQLRRQLAILSAQLEAPRAAPPVARSPAPLPQGPATGSPAVTDPPAGQRLFRFGRFAFDALQVASFLGLTVGTSGALAAGWIGMKSAVGWLRRRGQVQQQAPAAQAPAVAPTRFAPYPVTDGLAEAYDAAKRSMAQDYPGSRAALETLDSLIQQHLTGQEATGRRK